eukprot:18628-Heterococcus_DN1.PRE.1
MKINKVVPTIPTIGFNAEQSKCSHRASNVLAKAIRPSYSVYYGTTAVQYARGSRGSECGYVGPRRTGKDTQLVGALYERCNRPGLCCRLFRCDSPLRRLEGNAESLLQRTEHYTHEHAISSALTPSYIYYYDSPLP